jgi:group I intron endonuclease
METGSIYSVICKVNQKRYIGQTVKNVATRWKEHLRESSTDKGNRALYNAIKKYGQGMFSVRILEEDIPRDKLSEREVYWIEQFDTYNTGYNSTTGGEVSYTIREDVKEKISSSMIGLRRNDEFIEKQKLAANKRTNHFKVRGDGKHLSVKIRATLLSTGEVKEYQSLSEFCKETNIPNGNVSRAIKNGYMVKGYKVERLSNNVNRLGCVGYDRLTGRMLHEFRSVRQATIHLTRNKDAKGNRSLKRAIDNPRRTYKGCYWYSCCSL